MEDDYVSFELAKQLKEKGFHEYCSYAYNEKTKSFNYFGPSDFNKEIHKDLHYISAPTLYLVQKWLRKKKNIWLDIITDVANGENDNFKAVYFYKIIYGKNNNIIGNLGISNAYDTCEEALEVGIRKTLELI